MVRFLATGDTVSARDRRALADYRRYAAREQAWEQAREQEQGNG